MDGENRPSCRRCPLGEQCQEAGADGHGLSGAPLAARAAGGFLVPVAAAIAAVVVVPGQVAGLVAAVAAGVAAAGAVAAGAWVARRWRGA